MPKAAILQSSFSSGEVSPLYYGQADNPRYKKGLKACFNLLPTLQGPIVRRPATKYCAAAKATGSPPILIPFKFSQNQAYMLEFGNAYIRFFANNGQIVTTATTFYLKGTTQTSVIITDPVRGPLGYFYATRANAQLQLGETSITTQSTVGVGSILELASPYLTADLSKIRYAQTGDTLYLVHPNYPIYKLQRKGQTAWELFPVSLQDGPYLPLDTYQNYGDLSNFTVRTNTYTQSPVNNVGVSTVGIAITNAIADPLGSGQIEITTTSAHGLFTGQNVFISGVTGTTEANNWEIANIGAPTAYWPIQVTSPTKYLLVGSTFVHAYVNGGTSYPGLFALAADAYRKQVVLAQTVINPDAGRSMAVIISGVRYSGFLDGIPINASTNTILFPNSVTTVPSNTAATAWQLGVYSPGFGFPTCVTFHQNRLVFGGPGVAPQEVDGSVVGQYESFAPSDPATLNVSDKNAFSFQLNSSEINILQWMASTSQGLLAGSSAAEWVMTPASTSDALTATNFNAQQSSFFGSAPVAPVQLSNGTLYVQSAFRKIREMNYFFQAGTFRSADMTELSEHITIPQILQLSVTKETHPLIWAVRSDGALISMAYNRDDQSLIAGWSVHELGGRLNTAGDSPIVSSIASIPSPDLSFDQLWLVVARYLAGSTVYNIEYMTKIFDDSVVQEDAFQGDGGGTFYVPLTITGISTANPAVVTLNTAVPFSNGDRVKIVDVVGINKQTTDVNGNITTTNLVNEKQFVVAGVSGATFQLHDFSGNPVSSLGFGAYISSGHVAKMVTTISGASWLRGETISILADGGIHPDVAVDNSGSFTLNFPAAKIQFGFGFKSKGQLLRLDAGAPDGTAIGKTRRTTRLAVQLHRAGDLSLGTTFDNLIPVELSQADVDQADEPMPLFSGMIREGLESAYDFESEPCFEMSSMLPGCIQSLTSFLEENDV